MNRPSLEKFAPVVKPKGVVLINTSLIPIDSGRDDVDELKVPTVEIARKLGNVRCANIVALAAFVARTQVVSLDSLRGCVKEEFARKPKVIPINMAAIEAGIKAAD
jgi:2-oxoglutarate ferredoxin oxidoreductase subunit gamma